MPQFTFDKSGKLVPPDIYLQKRNLDNIGPGPLRYENLSGEDYSNDLNTVSFDVYRYVDGELNPLYDSVVDMQLAFIPGHGHYSLSVSIDSDGIAEHKTVTGTAWESELGKLYLQDFQANTAEEGDAVDDDGEFIQTVFYSDTEPERSLLHRMLRDTNWQIQRAKDTQEYLDVSAKVRVYDISWQDKYSFLKDLQDELDVVFVFDKYERKITWYTLDDYGNDTGIFITFENLAENVTVDSDDSKLVTELVVHGGEGIDVDQVIPAATNSLFKPDYFLTTLYMSQDTIDAYHYYMEYYEQAKEDYVNAMKSADSWDIKYIEYLTAKPLSSVEGEGTKEGTLKGLDEMTESELRENFAWKDGAEYNYGYNHLETIKATYEEVKAARDESGNTEDPKYDQICLIIDLAEEYMGILEPLINSAESQMNSYSEQAATIKTNCDLRIQFTKYFGETVGLTGSELSAQVEKSVQEINSFRITDEYTNENYIATENETYDYEAILAHTQELLDRAETELDKYCVPYLTWSCDLENLYLIPEFLPLVKDKACNAGDYVYVELHEGFSVRVRITNISYEYSDQGNLSFQFADRVDDEDVIDDISEMIGEAGSVASSMQYYAKQMDKYDDAYKEITEILTGGLDASKVNIYNNNNQEVITDEFGILCRKLLSDGIYSPEQLRLQSGQIVFTEDNWDTVSTALGKITLETSDGLVSTYGLIAKAVIAGYIQGSEIVGGKILSNNYAAGTAGSQINLTDGTFDFAGGKLTFDGTDLSVSGEINSETGNIGGFNIGNDYLANGTSSLAGATQSVYVGTDGISCGTAFKVTNTGVLDIGNGGLTYDGNQLSVSGKINAVLGTIAGFDIVDNSLSASWEGVGEGYSVVIGRNIIEFTRGYDDYYRSVSMNNNGLWITENGETIARISLIGKQFILPQGSFSGNVYPSTDGNINLGTSSYRWAQIYAASSTISTSDQNEKNTIEALDPTMSENLIRGLLPKSFKFNYGTSGRKHYGMIAQDIEALLSDLGVASQDFAAFVKYQKYQETISDSGIEQTPVTDEGGNPVYGYGLRYEEFIAPIIQCIQLLFDRIEELESNTK